NSLNTSVIHSGSTNVDFSGDQVTVRMNVLLNHFFGNGAYASNSLAKNNVAVKSPFGNEESVRVGYTKAKDADKWAAKDKEITKVEEPFSWTGFYIGAHAGGAWTDYDFNDFDSEVNVTPIFENNFPGFPAGNVDVPNAPNGPGALPASFIGFHTPGIDGGS